MSKLLLRRRFSRKRRNCFRIFTVKAWTNEQIPTIQQLFRRSNRRKLYSKINLKAKDHPIVKEILLAGIHLV